MKGTCSCPLHDRNTSRVVIEVARVVQFREVKRLYMSHILWTMLPLSLSCTMSESVSCPNNSTLSNVVLSTL